MSSHPHKPHKPHKRKKTKAQDDGGEGGLPQEPEQQEMQPPPPPPRMPARAPAQGQGQGQGRGVVYAGGRGANRIRLYNPDGSKTGARIDGSVRKVHPMGGRRTSFAEEDAARAERHRDRRIERSKANGTFDQKREAYNKGNNATYMDDDGKIHNQRDMKVQEAKADGSFDKKREEYNKGNKNTFMDETGKIDKRASSNTKGLEPPPPPPKAGAADPKAPAAGLAADRGITATASARPSAPAVAKADLGAKGSVTAGPKQAPEVGASAAAGVSPRPTVVTSDANGVQSHPPRDYIDGPHGTGSAEFPKQPAAPSNGRTASMSDKYGSGSYKTVDPATRPPSQIEGKEASEWFGQRERETGERNMYSKQNAQKEAANIDALKATDRARSTALTNARQLAKEGDALIAKNRADMERFRGGGTPLPVTKPPAPPAPPPGSSPVTAAAKATPAPTPGTTPGGIPGMNPAPAKPASMGQPTAPPAPPNPAAIPAGTTQNPIKTLEPKVEPNPLGGGPGTPQPPPSKPSVPGQPGAPGAGGVPATGPASPAAKQALDDLVQTSESGAQGIEKEKEDPPMGD